MVKLANESHLVRTGRMDDILDGSFAHSFDDVGPILTNTARASSVRAG